MKNFFGKRCGSMEGGNLGLCEKSVEKEKRERERKEVREA